MKGTKQPSDISPKGLCSLRADRPVTKTIILQGKNLQFRLKNLRIHLPITGAVQSHGCAFVEWAQWWSEAPADARRELRQTNHRCPHLYHPFNNGKFIIDIIQNSSFLIHNSSFSVTCDIFFRVHLLPPGPVAGGLSCQPPPYVAWEITLSTDELVKSAHWAAW